MELKLVSFKLCPFVKKAEILLNFKGIDYTTESIDLAQPPEWFMQISPLKKVPLLLVDEHVIFESSVICEYIDEAYPQHIHPENLILRAKNRSWIEFGNSCLWDSFYLTTKETKQDFDEVKNNLLLKFDQIERILPQGPYFNGAECSLVDLSFAPLLHYLNGINQLSPVIFFDQRHPKIIAWKTRLLQLEAVKASYSADLKALALEQIHKRQGYLSGLVSHKKLDHNIAKKIY